MTHRTRPVTNALRRMAGLMARTIALFTGQWADLPPERVCQLAAGWGYGALELAASGDHLHVRGVARDAALARVVRERV